jgi:hypothetical protein
MITTVATRHCFRSVGSNIVLACFDPYRVVAYRRAQAIPSWIRARLAETGPVDSFPFVALQCGTNGSTQCTYASNMLEHQTYAFAVARSVFVPCVLVPDAISNLPIDKRIELRGTECVSVSESVSNLWVTSVARLNVTNLDQPRAVVQRSQQTCSLNVRCDAWVNRHFVQRIAWYSAVLLQATSWCVADSKCRCSCL